VAHRSGKSELIENKFRKRISEMSMNAQILISVFSIVISVIASIFITALRNRAELKKIHEELVKNYAKSLFDKRIEYYPELYSISSHYSKICEYGKCNVQNLIEFRDKIDDWNNKYSLFFSLATSRISYRFRNYLNLLLHDGSSSAITGSDWKAMKEIRNAFEMSLRADIGILDTKPAGELPSIPDVINRLDNRIQELKKGEAKIR
jgi:hypothetical protein